MRLIHRAGPIGLVRFSSGPHSDRLSPRPGWIGRIVRHSDLRGTTIKAVACPPVGEAPRQALLSCALPVNRRFAVLSETRIGGRVTVWDIWTRISVSIALIVCGGSIRVRRDRCIHAAAQDEELMSDFVRSRIAHSPTNCLNEVLPFEGFRFVSRIVNLDL